MILSGKETLSIERIIVKERKDLSFPLTQREDRERWKWENCFGPLCKLKSYTIGNCLQNTRKGIVAVAMAFCSIAASSVDSPSLMFLPSTSLIFGLHFVGSVTH